MELSSDNKTLENLSNSSSFFRNMLMDRRVVFLAPEAIKIMNQRHCLATRQWPAPPKPSAYTVRQVCRSWCSGMDDFYEQHRFNTVELTSEFDEKHATDNLPLSGLLASESALSFLQHFDSTHANTERNPFIGRKIQVCTRFAGLYVLEVLQKYGRYVWSLKISDQESIHVGRLGMFLSTMPNLRRIEILDWSRVVYMANNGVMRLPSLPNVDTFKGKLEVALLSGIVHDNPSIVNLQLNIKTYRDLTPVDFPHVKHLKLKLYSKLRQICLNTPQLSKLIVHWEHDLFGYKNMKRRDYLFQWQRIFTFINRNWGQLEKLAEVELELPGFKSLYSICKNLERAAFYRLELQKVEKLNLVMHSPCSLDFILPMRESLKSLRVRIVYYSGMLDKSKGISKTLELAKARQRIKVLGFEDRLYSSNIWEMFPKLQKVVLEGHLKYATQAYPYRYAQKRTNEVLVYTRREWSQSVIV